MKEGILVIGSMNMDLVVKTEVYPGRGETVIGNNFQQVPGGKGANQALTAGKLGGSVTFIGTCGHDVFGDNLLKSLASGGVNTDSVFRVKEKTGVAAITVEANGDNRIVVVQGANKQLTPEKVLTIEEKIKEARVVLLQLEIPLETVIKTIELASQCQTLVVLDPAPACKLPVNLYNRIDYLLPNEGELNLLLKDYDIKETEEGIKRLLQWGVKNIVVTRGADGVSYYSKEGMDTYPAEKVEAADTTAAGDAFAGALAYGLEQKWNRNKIIEFANLVAALSVTKLGAQSSLPEIEEVMRFKAERGVSW